MRRAIAGALAGVIAAAAGAFAGSVTVAMTGFRNDDGRARVSLYAAAKGYPTDAGAAAFTLWVPIRNGAAAATFDEIPAGTYAVAVIHDENGNGKLDTFLGIPTEGLGASNNPKPRFGPPRFEDAAFAVAGNAAAAAVTITYLKK